MLAGLIAAIRGRPLASYVLLAWGLSWAYWLPMLIRGEVVTPGATTGASHFPGLLGPMIAALIITAIVGGRLGLREYLGRFVQWRVPLRWYGFAVLPMVIFLAVAGVLAVSGGPAPELGDLGEFSGLPELAWPLLILAVLVFNGYGEEAGWRGFLFEFFAGKPQPVPRGIHPDPGFESIESSACGQCVSKSRCPQGYPMSDPVRFGCPEESVPRVLQDPFQPQGLQHPGGRRFQEPRYSGPEGTGLYELARQAEELVSQRHIFQTQRSACLIEVFCKAEGRAVAEGADRAIVEVDGECVRRILDHDQPVFVAEGPQFRQTVRQAVQVGGHHRIDAGPDRRGNRGHIDIAVPSGDRRHHRPQPCREYREEDPVVTDGGHQ